MKKFSLKFILFVILVLFSSLAYSEGVFSKYYNDRFSFSIDVPVSNYENGMGENAKLDFVKNSKSIPSKNFFSAYEAQNSDGLTIKDKNGDITILLYGTNFLNAEEANGLDNIENIKDSFKDDDLNYNQFIKKYYNGKLPRNIDALKYDYKKTLFINEENVAYNTIGKDFYVVSYIEDNKIVYRKAIYNKDENSYVIFDVSYLAKDKKFMDNIVSEMVKSFKLIK